MGIYAKRLFPLICDRAMRAPELQARRAQLVDGTSGDVLEIGFGTGLSARFYDPGRVRRLIALEPSDGMTAKSLARIAAARVPIEMLELAGEDLPLPDASVDHVVCSLTLCSVADPARVLSEIRRVLWPGGALHFLEHVRSERPKIARWQDRLNGMQRRF
ncbi:MAG: class I SAM-dependent methyltransferase, partial [Pseudomonadota bacterium]